MFVNPFLYTKYREIKFQRSYAVDYFLANEL